MPETSVGPDAASAPSHRNRDVSCVAFIDRRIAGTSHLVRACSRRSMRSADRLTHGVTLVTVDLSAEGGSQKDGSAARPTI
jgi:hypothetical protein